MNDREFLIWIHERLVYKYIENPHMDYMHKLRCIITSIPDNQYTPNDGRGGNDMYALQKSLENIK